MGFFSWMTSDTNESIANVYSVKDVFTVYVLCPNGDVIKEECYNGYGKFGGRDIYSLVAQWNVPEKCKDENGNWLPDDETRTVGINIACYEEQNACLRYPIKIVRNKALKYDNVSPCKPCPWQGYFY